MKYIGAHVDSLPSVDVAPEQAHLLGASAFAFNLIDATRWNNPPYTDLEVERFRELCSRYGFGKNQILPHSAFVVNLCSPEPRKLALSRRTFTDELRRCDQLGIGLLNFHPGAHLKKMSEDEALLLVADSINYCLEKTEGVTAVIENTAGQGSNLGYSFEHLARIISKVEDKSRVGVCIDSAHAMAAGFDLSTEEGYLACWSDFAETVGFRYLKGMHINDSQREVGSRIDRHESVGHGTIGKAFFERLMADPRMDNIPMILETPDPAIWKEEIAWLKSLGTQAEN